MPTARTLYNIVDYGALPAPYDSSAAAQAAINACQTAGGGVVYVPPGAWFWGARPQITQSNVVVEGDGFASVINGGLDVTGATTASTTSTAPPGYLDVGMAVGSIAGAVVDGYVLLWGATPGSGTFGLVSKVQLLSTTPYPVVQVYHPIPVDMAGQPPAHAEFIAPPEGVVVRNLHFDGTNLGIANGVNVDMAARSRFENLWFTDFNGSGLWSGNGYQNVYRDILLERCGGRDPATGNCTTAAITLVYQTEATAAGLRALNSYGLGVYLGQSTYCDFGGPMSSTFAVDSPVATPGFNTGRGVKTSSVVFSFLPRAHSLNHPSTGIALTAYTSNNIGPEAVVLRIGRFPLANSDGIALWHNAAANRGNVEGSMILDGAALNSYAFGSSDYNNSVVMLRTGNAPGIDNGSVPGVPPNTAPNMRT